MGQNGPFEGKSHIAKRDDQFLHKIENHDREILQNLKVPIEKTQEMPDSDSLYKRLHSVGSMLKDILEMTEYAENNEVNNVEKAEYKIEQKFEASEEKIDNVRQKATEMEEAIDTIRGELETVEQEIEQVREESEEALNQHS